MKRSTKIWLLTAASLVLVGLLTFVLTMTLLGWDFTKLSDSVYVTKSYEITDSFSSVSLDIETADLTVVRSEDSKGRIVCYEDEALSHRVEVKDGILKIIREDTRKWYDYVSVGFKSDKIILYIPVGEYGALSIKTDTGDIEIPSGFKFESIDISGDTSDVRCSADVSGGLKVKTSTGDIDIEDMSAGALDLSVSTGSIRVSEVKCDGDFAFTVSSGKAYLKDVECKNLTTSGKTGDLSLDRVIAREKLTVQRSTGDVSLSLCDAAEIYIETSTGEVDGTLLSDKVFFTSTSTGDVDVPKTVSGGKCEIITSTGDIEISITKTTE